MRRTRASCAAPARTTVPTPARCTSPSRTGAPRRSRATPTTRSRSASSAGRSRTTSTASTRSDRILHPLVREDGGFRRASWDEALDRVAEALLARARRVRRRVDPPVQLHGHAGPDPGQHDVRARDERARRLGARAHDLRDGRDHRHAAGPRRVAGGRSGGVAERPLPADLGLEPAVHRAAPLAQAARRAQPGRAARGGGSRSAAARPGSPTSTSARCRAPTPPSPSG